MASEARKHSALFAGARGGVVALLALLAQAAAGPAREAEILHDFCGAAAGKCGYAANGPTMDGAGDLFGTAANGGANGDGEIFELKRGAKNTYAFEILYTFCAAAHCKDGAHPVGSLIVDTSGNLYGATAGGGTYSAGEVFELKSNAGNWAISSLHNFCRQPSCGDGASPGAGVTYQGAASGAAYDGTSPLFGTTIDGRLRGNGVVYELVPGQGGWLETPLYTFCSQPNCADGSAVMAPLVDDASGNLYGTANGGGSNAHGTVFELSPSNNSWSETVLYNFCGAANCADGASPQGGLVMDAFGNLFGVTPSGGNSCNYQNGGCGVLYEIVPDGTASTESVLHAFCARQDCADGAIPYAAPVLDDSGNLFGTADVGGSPYSHGGVVFVLSGPALRTVHAFCSRDNCTDHVGPAAGIIRGPSGRLFGTTSGTNSPTMGATVYALRP